MDNDVTNSRETGTAALVGDIISDAQDLVKQQLHLFRVEIREDVNKVKKAAPAAFLALTMILGGVFLLGLALATLLFWAFNQAVPLWVWQGVVAIVWVGLGVAIFLVLAKSHALSPIPEQSMEALKENVEWKTNPK